MFNMSLFTDIESVLDTPFLVNTMKIGTTIGNGIGSVATLLITMLLIILYMGVIESGHVVFYLWDSAMQQFRCKTLIRYNHYTESNAGPRYTIFTMFHFCSIYLENIVVSDKDNHYVTNAWNSYILVLFGTYTEHTVITDASNTVQELESAQLRRGYWRYQAKNVYHKITLKKNTNAWVLRLAFKQQHEPNWVEISDNKIKSL
jgi:hypothetical protein